MTEVIKDNTNTPIAEIEAVMERSQAAFEEYRQYSAEQRAALLDAIASEIEAIGDALLAKAAEESNLPLPRLTGERGRATGQLRMFAEMAREGSWVEATIDTALPDRQPLPRPDIRKVLVPLGPVVVFGASNFPFAFSTAGGDTASALAAGCTVVIKAHPAHAETSDMVFEAMQKALKSLDMPAAIVQHVHGESFETGKALVQAEYTAGVGFTGSTAGGKALVEYSRQRKSPIPVFAEMGSVNPVIILPETLSANSTALAAQLAGSITLGAGQFCTNPGLLFAVKGDGFDSFTTELATAIGKIVPSKMLHAGIHAAYLKNSEKALSQPGVSVLGKCQEPAEGIAALPAVAIVDAAGFLQNPLLHEEVFGPYSLVIACESKADVLAILKEVIGQLTVTVMGTEADLLGNQDVVTAAGSIAGRILFNGVPTGVEVCNSMVHGGPFPATTDSRFTAVGIGASKRWVRPLSIQNCPQSLLPAALKDGNPLNIWRLVNNEWTKA